MSVDDQGQRPRFKGASSADGESQELYDDRKRGPAIDPGTRYTRIIGYAEFVVRDVDDLVTSASDAVDGCAGETGKRQTVEVRHGEGVANRTGPDDVAMQTCLLCRVAMHRQVFENPKYRVP